VKDITVVNGITKKNRPTYVIKVICSEQYEKEIAKIIFEETGTLGIRRSKIQRYVLDRFNLMVPLEIEKQTFVINVKISKNSHGKIINIKPEFEDIKKTADKLNYSLKKTTEIVNNLISQKNLYAS
ncbi:MAG: nickel insertion protein, partial [Candidatus Nitrosocosmicus sp.]